MTDLLPRLLVLIGSGEMAAHMTRGHRMLVERLTDGARKPRDLKAAIIDTPYGFQENADELSSTLVDYFGNRIGMDAALASFRRDDVDALSSATAFARIRDADFVFSGPGSPSYALRHWAGTEMRELFADKLFHGGALVLASAAACTLGQFTVPVYEIYKVGEDPYWLPGLDVLAAIGIHAAVIPHYDNAEGGGHDTRFCFLGERRLLVLEEQLPADVCILGIDEHTALLLDLDTDSALVHGRGGVSIRRDGEAVVYPSGTEIPMADLRGEASPRPEATKRAAPGTAPQRATKPDLAARLVALEDRVAGLTRRSDLVEPLIGALVDLRRDARASGDYATADAIRNRLAGLGIEVADSVGGTTARIRH